MDNQRKEYTTDELTAEIEALRAENERLQQQVDMLKKAVQYALNEKRYLYGFLDNHGIEISNNRAENAICPFVVGRKNWLFSDSPKGASASAMLYSLVVSAKMNGLNAEDYLIRLFRSPDPVLPYETT